MPGLASNCPRCGAPLAPGALGTLCPRCLAGVALQPPSHDPSLSPRSFGDYELLEEIARGGMGVVFRARQLSLNRIVALKRLSAADLATPAQVQRFLLEAKAAAKLDHPNIVPIFEVGERQGQHFYSMKLIEGGSLADWIRARHPAAGQPAAPGPGPPLQEIARLVARVAAAVHHAHQHGILHRDLKPGNLLLDEAGEPHVADFGLAKVLESESSLTRSAAILGTPAYMAPEQAMGGAAAATVAADVYSLGAILYELLTGTPPFTAENIPALLRCIAEEEPTPPSLRLPRHGPPAGAARRIDRDLECICLKCLEKDPLRRYPSAGALAEDLERWIRGEVITARPAGRAERIARWCRRKPALAALSASVAFLALAILAGSALGAWRLSRAHQATADQRAQALAAKAKLELANEQLARANIELTRSVDLLELQRAESQFAKDDSAMGLAYLAETVRRTPSNHLAAARLVSALQWRHFALPLGPPKLLSGHVESAEFSPDGSRIVIASDAREAAILDAVSLAAVANPLRHRDRVLVAHFSPDGARVVTASADGTAALWDSQTGRSVAPPLAHNGPVYGAEISRDGARCLTASADHTARVWDATTGALLLTLRGHSHAVAMARFSPDGSRIATASGGNGAGSARFWDAATGRQHGPALAHPGPVTSLMFSPDGRRLVTGCEDHAARLWSCETGTASGDAMWHRGRVVWVAFSPDGSRVATVSADRTARIWDAATGKPLTEPLRHTDQGRFAVFSRDGKWLATTGADLSARVWDARTGEPIFEPVHHPEQIVYADFSPDRKRLITASYDWTVRLWNLEDTADRTVSFAHTAGLTDVNFSPDGNWIATASLDRTARVWDRAGRPVGPAVACSSPMTSVQFSPDGTRLLTADAGGQARVTHIRTGEPIGQPMRHPGALRNACFSPDGRKIATAGADGTARVWDAATGTPLTGALQHASVVEEVTFSPDGRYVATASKDATARVWSAETGQPAGPPLPHRDLVNRVCFSPDGTRLATASRGDVAVAWDWRAGQPALPLLRHTRGVNTVEYSRDGTMLATGCLDGGCFLWDARTGAPLTEALRHGDYVSSARFSPDGRRLVTGSWDGTARIWDTRTGQPLSEPLRHHARVLQARFAPDGRSVVTTSDQLKAAQLWEIAELPPAAPAWLPALAECFGGRRFNNRKTVELVPWSDLVATLELVRTNTAADAYARLGRWLVGNRTIRSPGPFAPAPVRERPGPAEGK